MDDFYTNIPNRVQIESILKPYDIQDCMADFEFFSEFYWDLIEEHPTIPHLQIVLERMLVASFAQKSSL